MRWLFLPDGAHSGACNMARDDALLARAQRTGEAVLRVYRWSRPTLSLGRHQTAAGLYDVERAAAWGVDIVRRPTGGRAVLHCREVTYSVAAPVGPMGDLAESYTRINRLLIDALHRLGSDAELARPASVAPRPGIAPCFETPVAGEIVAGGRKLVGSAQLREGDALLQHGSILIDDDQWLASSLLSDPTSAPAPPAAATLRRQLGRAPSVEEVTAALHASLLALEDPAAATLEADPLLEEAAREAERRYHDDGWTWRR